MRLEKGRDVLSSTMTHISKIQVPVGAPAETFDFDDFDLTERKSRRKRSSTAGDGESCAGSSAIGFGGGDRAHGARTPKKDSRPDPSTELLLPAGLRRVSAHSAAAFDFDDISQVGPTVPLSSFAPAGDEMGADGDPSDDASSEITSAALSQSLSDAISNAIGFSAHRKEAETTGRVSANSSASLGERYVSRGKSVCTQEQGIRLSGDSREVILLRQDAGYAHDKDEADTHDKDTAVSFGQSTTLTLAPKMRPKQVQQLPDGFD